MLYRFNKNALCALLLAAASACSDGATSLTAPPPAPDPVPSVLLKDITINNLPNPFYHFEYDGSRRITAASFASDLRRYNLHYTSGRLSTMQNNILINKDRLTYSYDADDRVSEVAYADSNGTVYTRVRYTYDGPTLIGVERQRVMASGTFVDKTMTLAYNADGNLSDLTEHHPAIAGVQDEVTFTDHFEQYDIGLNVDGFSLLHSEFFDHLVLLPRVVLQTGNPRLVTRTGDGLTYRVAYTYTYDDRGRPLSKIGDLTITSGETAGQHVQISSAFSYYD